jgi:hypothetical protein
MLRYAGGAALAQEQAEAALQEERSAMQQSALGPADPKARARVALLEGRVITLQDQVGVQPLSCVSLLGNECARAWCSSHGEGCACMLGRCRLQRK